MATKPKDIESIYSSALAKTDEAERRSYLDSVCAGNPALHARVEALLKAHDRAGQFLETPPPFMDAAPIEETLTEHSGTVIDKYSLKK